MGLWRDFWAGFCGRPLACDKHDDERLDRDDVLSDIQVDTAATRLAVNQLFRKIDRLRETIVATAAELIAAFNAATDEVASDLQTVRDQLATALADQDQAVQDAVNAALAGFDAPLARLQALGQDPENPVPAPEPQPEPSPEPPADDAA